MFIHCLKVNPEIQVQLHHLKYINYSFTELDIDAKIDTHFLSLINSYIYSYNVYK